MELPVQRHLFEIPDDVAYLNCAYMSPQLRSVRAAGEAAVAAKSRPWTITPPDFFTPAEEARTLLARLVGGDADGVAVVPSVSYGITLAAANVEIGDGQRILVLAEQFPSNVYPWWDAAARSGAEITTVARPADGDWTTAVEQQLDHRSAVVAIPAVHWTDGGLVDLQRVGNRARDVGAALVVDVTQSLGATPVDVTEVQPDFLVSAAYKWLLGPYSLAFVWVAPHRRSGRALEANWITRAGSEDFAGLVDYRSALAPGARRYDMGERSNFVLLPMAIAALRQLLEWGVENTAATIRPLCDRIAAGGERLGLEPTPAGARADHLLGLRAPAGLPEDLVARLAGANVHVSVRGSSIRVSPHVYNTAADVDRLLDVLDGVW